MFYDYKDSFMKEFPQIKEKYLEILSMFPKANCTSCAKRKRTRLLSNLISEMMRVDPKKVYPILKEELPDREYLYITTGQVIEPKPSKEYNMYLKYAEEISNTFKNIKPTYDRIILGYDQAGCKSCIRSSTLSRLANVVNGELTKGTTDLTPLEGVLTKNQIKNLGKVMTVSRKTCKECVKKHLSSAYVILNEVMNGHPENKMFLNAELKEASGEGWEIKFDAAIKMSNTKLKKAIEKTLDCGTEETLLLGYLAKAEEITSDLNIKDTLRKIRQSFTKLDPIK